MRNVVPRKHPIADNYSVHSSDAPAYVLFTNKEAFDGGVPAEYSTP